MGLNDKVRELAEALKATAEFSELRQAKAVLDKNSVLKSEVDRFNKRQAELMSSKLPAKEAEAVLAELNKKFGELSRFPEVDKFLRASQRFNELVAATYSSINNSIEAGLKK